MGKIHLKQVRLGHNRLHDTYTMIGTGSGIRTHNPEGDAF